MIHTFEAVNLPESATTAAEAAAGPIRVRWRMRARASCSCRVWVGGFNSQ